MSQKKFKVTAARRAIAELLATEGPLTGHEMAKKLGKSYTTVLSSAQKMAKLKLIRATRNGRKMSFSAFRTAVKTGAHRKQLKHVQPIMLPVHIAELPTKAEVVAQSDLATMVNEVIRVKESVASLVDRLGLTKATMRQLLGLD